MPGPADLIVGRIFSNLVELCKLGQVHQIWLGRPALPLPPQKSSKFRAPSQLLTKLLSLLAAYFLIYFLTSALGRSV